MRKDLFLESLVTIDQKNVKIKLVNRQIGASKHFSDVSLWTGFCLFFF